MVEMLGAVRSMITARTTLAWTELGEGPPLLLLHGLGDSHRTFRRVAPRLAERFRVLMPDLPGHGLSGRPDAPYTLEWYSRAIIEWLDAIGVARTHVVGHSFGGGVAQWMMLHHRSRIDRLVLVAPGGLGRDVNLSLRLSTFPILGPMITPKVMNLGTGAVMRLASASFAHQEPHEIDRLVAMNCKPGTARAFQRTVRGCIDLFGQHMQTWDRLHEIEAFPPIAIIWGDRDIIIPVRHGVMARERLENVTLSVFPRCGHYPHLAAPERFTRELFGFLEGQEVATARVRTRRATARRSHPLWRYLEQIVANLTTEARRSVHRVAAYDSPRIAS
ncbi:MAG: hypothetical protein NVS3B20_08980 [Polyangiales bacterium]